MQELAEKNAENANMANAMPDYTHQPMTYTNATQ
jgi:hypothetical protein